jgi:hypothetical protein
MEDCHESTNQSKNSLLSICVAPGGIVSPSDWDESKITSHANQRLSTFMTDAPLNQNILTIILQMSKNPEITMRKFGD